MEDGHRYTNRLTPQEMVDLQEDMREIDQDAAEIAREREEHQKRMAARRRNAELKRRKQMRIIKASAAGICLLLVVGIGSCVSMKAHKKSEAREAVLQKQYETAQEAMKQAEAEAAVVEAAERRKVKLSAAGDNLVSQRLIDQAAEGSSYDFSKAYSGTVSFIKEHEINWIDIETTINDEIEPSGYPTFSTPGEDGKALVDAGFNIFSLANNHSYDLGAAGMNAAKKYWNGIGGGICVTGFNEIAANASGAEDITSRYSEQGLLPQSNVRINDIPTYICENGKKVAFLTYVTFTNPQSESYDSEYITPDGANSRVIYAYERDLIKAQIEAADELADAVVVSCHWGTEDSHEINDDQREMAQFLADCGADLIIGDHPHQVQDGAWLEAADGRMVFCAYSLGNFVSTQEDDDNIVGVLLDCTLHFAEAPAAGEPEVTIEDPRLVPVITVYGEEGTDAHVIMFSDFTEDMAKKHGIHGYIYEDFTRESVEEMLKDAISEEFRGF